MYNKEINEKLGQIRGTILSDSVVIESALSWNLRTYFFPKTNQQASDFLYHILETPYFSFDKKISLYEQIPYFKKLKRYAKTKEALRFIQQVRNAVAHWELDEKTSNKNEIVLVNITSFKIIKINSKLIEKFKEHEKFLLKIFGWEQTLREKYGRK
ncbi:hypothetical protein HYU07_05830 [Candidatus Woesearchaeota archaeon]|nr:hypothetical protein [Candidatus Woesearchaeota archaeon]